MRKLCGRDCDLSLRERSERRIDSRSDRELLRRAVQLEGSRFRSRAR